MSPPTLGSTSASMYTLYYGAHSVCSIMTRLSWALRGQPKTGSSEMQLKEQEVDIGPKMEQLREEFLCDINPEGYVPVLVNGSLTKPMPESKDITWYIADRYPGLLPEEHSGEIKRLVNELHEISFYALTFGGLPKRGLELQKKINELLSQPDISDRYREALRYKLRQRQKLEEEIVEEPVKANEGKAREYLAQIAQIKETHQSAGPYIHGAEPTALDGHVIPFLLRLYDKKREYLIPEALLAYALKFREGEIWKSIMPQLYTVPSYA